MDRRVLLVRLDIAASQATYVGCAIARYIVLVLIQLSALRDSSPRIGGGALIYLLVATLHPVRKPWFPVDLVQDTAG
jgi:hypothetical protein